MPPLARKLYSHIAIDFFHDLAAGMVPGVALAAWVLRASAGDDGAAIVAVTRAGGSLALLMVLALAVSVGTGLLRLKYWKLNTRAGYLETRGQMAAVKHALFVLTVVISAFVLAIAVG